MCPLVRSPVAGNGSWASKSILPFFLVAQLDYISQPPCSVCGMQLKPLAGEIWVEVIHVFLPGLAHGTSPTGSSMLFPQPFTEFWTCPGWPKMAEPLLANVHDQPFMWNRAPLPIWNYSRLLLEQKANHCVRPLHFMFTYYISLAHSNYYTPWYPPWTSMDPGGGIPAQGKIKQNINIYH